jgi:amino acid adenylation domain-containing protein
MVQLLQDYVTRIATDFPEQLMIQDGSNATTYGEMETFTNRFARYLVSAGVTRQQPVAFLMDKSTNSFRALISILKADAVYVPLNVRTPDERNRYILDHARCPVLICDATSASQVSRLLEAFDGRIQVINIDDSFSGDNRSIEGYPRAYGNIDRDLAYLMYTSGSTGVPKGVMISHRNVIDYAEWTADFFRVTKADRLSSHPGLYFDLSTFDVYTAFKSGASLHLVPAAASMFPIRILEFIEENSLTVWNSVPSLLTFIAKSGVLRAGRLPSLRTVTFNGEVMPTQTVIEWMRACPDIRFVNQYGPTETTCASMYYEITAIPQDPTKPIPIGIAIPNSEVLVLTPDGKVAATAEVGELHIRGSGNGLGYLHDQEKTDRQFVRSPLAEHLGDRIYATGDLVRLGEDGNHEFMGRSDHQIKFMGFRVELGEIESTLDSFDYVVSSAALGIEGLGIGGAVIVAYIVSKATVASSKVKDDLARRLPRYMVPREIIDIRLMPLSSNGKIDRIALKQLYLEGASRKAKDVQRGEDSNKREH